MTSTNPNSLDHQGQFHAKVHPTQTHGGPWHKPGNEQGKAAVHEFHAETYPPGTAPKESTFQPMNTYDTPTEGTVVDYPASTSRDLHGAHGVQEGRPVHGQTSREVHGAHAGKNKREGTGLEGVGATSKGQSTVEGYVRDNAFDKDQAAKGQRGKSGAAEGGLAWEGA
ncbi:hypothetical protein BR93DRAFT_221776 [Coniochaeta sp. PMI_546]|nr:hypothetical protein BR93DRAFT_221776 [Coniochaeta sp. PMI_546]